MSLTVRELVSRPHLSLDLLVSGDLEREIRWVHSSDMPDPAPYLRGGEVVLTAGIWYWHGTAASAFAAGLGRADAAALGFGTSALVREVPPELVDACSAWGLTLFRVPDDISFIEIAEEFVEAQHRLREQPLIDSLDRSGRLVDCLQSGSGVEGLLAVFTRLTGRPSAVLRHGAVVASTRPDVPAPVAASFAIPTASHDAVLVVEGHPDELSVAERATIDQAVAFLAIELQRERAVAESERRFAGELFDLVAAGEPQRAAVAARLQTFGVDAERPLLAVCCEPADDVALAHAQSFLDERAARGVFAVKAGELVGVLELDADDPALVGADLHEALGAGVLVGVGGAAAGAGGLVRSLTEARHACRFARRRRDAGYATHDALASHDLLLALQDEHVLRAFHDTLLRPLQEHDLRRHTDLVRTLDEFLGSGGRYQATADTLHLHVNTLRLRLARIEELTGRDLGSMGDRVDLWLALRSRGEAG
jgi:sugar diacid utilization regulator